MATFLALLAPVRYTLVYRLTSQNVYEERLTRLGGHVAGAAAE